MAVAMRRLRQLVAGGLIGSTAAGLVASVQSVMGGLLADFETATYDMRVRQALASARWRTCKW